MVYGTNFSNNRSMCNQMEKVQYQIQYSLKCKLFLHGRNKFDPILIDKSLGYN